VLSSGAECTLHFSVAQDCILCNYSAG
jgi:hypothetical protein